MPHTKSKWVKVGIDDKSTNREIRVLVTSIEHVSTSYDSTHYLCNKLHVNTHFKNPEARADNLITATIKVIS